jgi:hypothetical protein
MMTNPWIYQGGELDPSGRALPLISEGPSMVGDGTTSMYKDVIEFKSDDHRVLNAQVQAEDGSWRPLMSMDYRRKR